MDFKRSDRGLLFIYLENECPRIGSGWRNISYHVGNKKVKLRCTFQADRTCNIGKRVLSEIVDGSDRRGIRNG